MNAVEIEEAISALAEQAFDPAEFPFAFLQAFGNKETTIRKLRVQFFRVRLKQNRAAQPASASTSTSASTCS